MGAAPSRVTHRRGLFVPPPHAYGKSQDIVMIPLTREFFPSPECPLFVQFHKACSDATVNYYLRHPCNSRDPSRIPNYADPHPEVDDGGVGDFEKEPRAPLCVPLCRMQDTFMNRKGGSDTLGEDAEKGLNETIPQIGRFPSAMEGPAAGRECVDSYVSRETLYRYVVDSIEEILFDTDEEMRIASERERDASCETCGEFRRRTRKVLPVMCAIAFLLKAHKVETSDVSGKTLHSFSANEQVFGESYNAYSIDGAKMNLSGRVINIVGCFGFVPVQEEAHVAHLGNLFMSLGSPVPMPVTPQLSSCANSQCKSHSLSTPQQSTTSGSEQPLGDSEIEMEAVSGVGKGKEEVLLMRPPSALAPLAGVIFLTKSAGEQKLSHATYAASSTYYFQMIQAGVIERCYDLSSPLHSSTSALGKEGLPASFFSLPRFLPPMETFSFSGFLTNIPFLSFLYEMKRRWCHLGMLKPSASGAPDGPGGKHVGLDVMETWITPDQMLHTRISDTLGSRLCWSLAERPEVLLECPAQQLTNQGDGYWRYRGLVDRAHPPQSPSPLTLIDPKDVYVMGSDALPGFDKGDVLRFDAAGQVWFADPSIPIEAVVLVAMRPHCKRARESDPQDPGWVTRLVPVEEEPKWEGGLVLPVPPPTPEQAAIMEANPGRYKLVHESMRNFYVYRFEYNGTTYYHGTVPNFAKQHKKKLPLFLPLDSFSLNSVSGQSTTTSTFALSSANFSKSPLWGTQPTSGSASDLLLPAHKTFFSSLQKYSREMICSVRSSDTPRIESCLTETSEGVGPSNSPVPSAIAGASPCCGAAPPRSARGVAVPSPRPAPPDSPARTPRFPTPLPPLAAAPVLRIRVISRGERVSLGGGVGALQLRPTRAPRRYIERGRYTWDWREAAPASNEDAV